MTKQIVLTFLSLCTDASEAVDEKATNEDGVDEKATNEDSQVRRRGM